MKYVPTIITQYHNNTVRALFFSKSGVKVLSDLVPFSVSVEYSHNKVMYNLLEKLVELEIYEVKPKVISYELNSFTGFKYYLEEEV